MELFKIGNVEVPVSVKPNKRLKGRRLSVSSSGVLVEAPEELLGSIEKFLQAKSSWIFTEWQKHKGTNKELPWPEEFTTGAKVLFQGRYTPMLVIDGGPEVEVTLVANGFVVKCPDNLSNDQKSALIKNEFVEFFSKTLDAMAMKCSKMHELHDLKVTINQRKDRWAYCREDHVIVLGWDLVFLPKPVIEYVIVHELVHIKVRNHGKDFWSALATYLPDWREREAALKEYESKVNFGTP